MELLQCQENVGCVEPGRVLLKPADLAEVEEEFTTWAVLETEEEFVLRLEGIVHLDDERVVDTFLKTIIHHNYLLECGVQPWCVHTNYGE